MTVYILGGGPTGLAVAHGLALESDTDFVLMERGPRLGGMAQTLWWGEHGCHDLGPHKLFTQDAELMARLQGLLPPEDWLVRDKISRVYIGGHFLDYPPSPFALAGLFGLRAFWRMGLGYCASRIAGLRRGPKADTFEEDLQRRLGSCLYEILFEPMALKLWGEPGSLDAKLSRARVQTPSLLEVLSIWANLRRSSGFEALSFHYPRGGLHRLWEAIRAETEERGAYLLEHRVTGIEVDDGRVTGIRCRNGRHPESGIKIDRNDFVVSTLPLGLLAELMGGALSSRASTGIREVVHLNDLLLVFLKIDRLRLFPDSWIFVPDPEIAFHRISEQESFDPAMAPGGSIVCCEIMSHRLRPMSTKSDEELVAEVERGLADMGYAGFSILDARVIRLARSYPVFRVGFERALTAILEELDEFENLRTVGRQGAFNYIGTLDAMDIGYGLARWLTHRTANPWSEERRRTRHYPVLD